jgi:hypothetical protein
MNLLHLLEYLAFVTGWFAKGVLVGLASQAIFQPLSKRIWRTLKKRAHAKADGYVAHHLAGHETFKYDDCEICQPTPTSVSPSKA